MASRRGQRRYGALARRSGRPSQRPISAAVQGIIASTAMHDGLDRNGGSSVAEPTATCPASTPTPTSSAITAAAARHSSAGNRQLGGRPRR